MKRNYANIFDELKLEITEFLTLLPKTGICLPVMLYAMPHTVLLSYGHMEGIKDYFEVEHHAI